MSCLPTWKRNLILEQIAKKKAQLLLAEESYESALSNAEIESYRFDPGDAVQQAKRRSLKEISDEVTRLEAEISNLYRRLYGTGIVSMNLRRKNYRSDRRHSRGRR